MSEVKEGIIPVREQVYNRIKSAILSNEYEPGDIIPIDRLAREIGISATPIREAIIRLESTGLLELIPNKGARVIEITPRDITDNWELRLILEPYAARKTALLDLDEEIQELERHIHSLMEKAYDHESYVSADNELHRLLFSHVENTVLRETIERIHYQSLRMRYYAENVSQNNKEVIQKVCSEHLEILDALKAKDPAKTEQAVKRHLRNGEQRTLATTLAKQK